MLADEILALNFDNSSVRKKLELYNYGLSSSKENIINFVQLKKFLAEIASDKEENDHLMAEFIRGFSDGFPD